MAEKNKFISSFCTIATIFFNSYRVAVQTVIAADKWFFIYESFIRIVFIKNYAGDISLWGYLGFPPADQFIFWRKGKKAEDDCGSKNSFHLICFNGY